MAAANGVRRVWVGKNTLLSTPAVSAVIRERSGADVRYLSLSLWCSYLWFCFFSSLCSCLSTTCMMVMRDLTPVSGNRDQKQREHLS